MKNELINILNKLEALTFEVRELALKEFDKPAERNIQIEITSILQKCGFTANLKGYHYMRDAVLIAIDDISVVSTVTSQLYPKLALKYGVTPSSVERAMRHAIEVSWGSSGAPKTSDALGCVMYSKPTISRFVAIIADKFRTEG